MMDSICIRLDMFVNNNVVYNFCESVMLYNFKNGTIYISKTRITHTTFSCVILYKNNMGIVISM